MVLSTSTIYTSQVYTKYYSEIRKCSVGNYFFGDGIRKTDSFFKGSNIGVTYLLCHNAPNYLQNEWNQFHEIFVKLISRKNTNASQITDGAGSLIPLE